MGRMLKLYLAFAKVNFLTQMEYRGQYAIRMLAKIIGWSTGFVSILILLNKFKTIGNWTAMEVLFIYAMDVLSYSIAATFCMGSVGKIPTLIRNGSFDSVLTKPVNSFCYLICKNVSAGYVSNYIIGIVIMAVCMQRLGIVMTFGKLCWLIVVILGATLIQAAGFILTAVPAFWLVNIGGLRGLFYGNLTGFLQYPLVIYDKWVQVLLTFILPYAFINYYPAQYFLGKNENLFFPWFQYMTPVVGMVLFGLSYFIWTRGLNAY